MEHQVARPEIREAGRIQGYHCGTTMSSVCSIAQHGSGRIVYRSSAPGWHHVGHADDLPSALRQVAIGNEGGLAESDQARSHEVTLRNASPTTACVDAGAAAPGDVHRIIPEHRAWSSIIGITKLPNSHFIMKENRCLVGSGPVRGDDVHWSSFD
jgi:hypothetical protein